MDDLTGIYLYVAAEDELNLACARRLIEDSEGRLHVGEYKAYGGKNRLEKEAKELARSATTHRPNLLATDLDNEPCPAAMREEWLRQNSVPDGLLFLVAVREVEAWVLADRVGFIGAFGVPDSKILRKPECLCDPKDELLRLIDNYSQSQIKRGIVVVDRGRRSGKRSPGPRYNEALSKFVQDVWRPKRASEVAPSLARAIQRIQEFADKFVS